MSHKGTQVYAAPDLFANDMRKVINEMEHSDITFVVGEDREKIHAHKIILAGKHVLYCAAVQTYLYNLHIITSFLVNSID